MVRERLAAYRDRARHELITAFRETHTPHQVAASFAIGIFVTSFPTGGLGVGLFFVFISLWSWISKPAIFASVAVLNPFVKPAVYVGSFQLGAVLLGPNSVRSAEATTAESAWIGVQQLLLGNIVIAVVLSGLAYVTVLHLTRVYRRRAGRHSGGSPLSTVLEPFRRWR